MGSGAWYTYLEWHDLLLSGGLVVLGLGTFVVSFFDPGLPVWVGLGWLLVVGIFTGIALRQTAAVQRRRALERSIENP